jgi:hypothetical protein
MYRSAQDIGGLPGKDRGWTVFGSRAAGIRLPDTRLSSPAPTLLRHPKRFRSSTMSPTHFHPWICELVNFTLNFFSMATTM